MGKHKKIINTAIAAFILVVGLFTKPLHVKAACLSHNGAGPMSSTEVIVGTCTIAGNTKEFFDWATSENDTVNRSDLQILPGASMTLAAGTTGLAVGKLTITGGSISIGSGASISVGAPIYVDDAYSTGTPDNSNHYSSAAAGRRRLAMMGNFLMEGDGHDGPLTLNPASLTTYNINTNVLTTVGSDLVSWWKMDNVSSNTTPDSWGTNTGTTSQSTTVQGRYFNALNFNGTSDYVTVPDAASLDPSNITLEAWVNPDVAGMDGQSTMIIDKARGAAATYDGYLLFYSDNGSYGINSLVLSVATPGSPSTRREWVDNAFPSKRWYHVAATYDGSDTKIYIDGVEKATTVTVNGTGNIDGNAYQLAIGKASTDGGYYFKGQIDDVRLYNSARTQQQIQADMNSCGSGSWRTTADGEAFPVSAIQSTSLPNTITLTGTGSDGTAASNASQTFTPGDEILLINQQGTIADGAPNVGNFEFLRVGNVAGAVLTVVGSIKRVYGATGDTNNSTLTGQKIVVQRVPNYTDVQIGSSAVLSAAAWNGTRGGIIAFRASGALTFYQNGGNGGIIDAVAVGYRGGTAGIAAGGGVTESSGGGGGESICGYNTGNGASSTTSPVPTGIPGSCGGGGGGARGPSDGGSGEQSAGGAAGTAGGGAGGGG